MTDYGASDTSTTALGANQFPIGEVYVPSGTQTSAAGGALTALEGGPASTDSASPAKRSAPASMWIKDGNNITFGAEADAAITDSTQTTKTHMAFLKGLVKIFADVWDSANHRLAVGAATTTLYTLASTTTSGSTQNSGDLDVSKLREISIDINTTAQAGTSPTIQYFYERKGADGLYYVLWQSAVLTAATNTISTSVGAGMAYPLSLGLTGRLRWVVGGSATPTFTHSINCYGK